MDDPNGVGLSPDGKTLYVVETSTDRLYSFPGDSPGVLVNMRQSQLLFIPLWKDTAF